MAKTTTAQAAPSRAQLTATRALRAAAQQRQRFEEDTARRRAEVEAVELEAIDLAREGQPPTLTWGEIGAALGVSMSANNLMNKYNALLRQLRAARAARAAASRRT